MNSSTVTIAIIDITMTSRAPSYLIRLANPNDARLKEITFGQAAADQSPGGTFDSDGATDVPPLPQVASCCLSAANFTALKGIVPAKGVPAEVHLEYEVNPASDPARIIWGRVKTSKGELTFTF